MCIYSHTPVWKILRCSGCLVSSPDRFGFGLPSYRTTPSSSDCAQGRRWDLPGPATTTTRSIEWSRLPAVWELGERVFCQSAAEIPAVSRSGVSGPVLELRVMTTTRGFVSDTGCVMLTDADGRVGHWPVAMPGPRTMRYRVRSRCLAVTGSVTPRVVTQLCFAADPLAPLYTARRESRLCGSLDQFVRVQARSPPHLTSRDYVLPTAGNHPPAPPDGRESSASSRR